MSSNKPIKAWLVMWEWVGDHAAVADPIVDILSARKSVEYMRDHLDRLHNLKCMSLGERTAMARYNQPMRPVYPAQVVRPANRSSPPEIHCGHNPWLVARLVQNLTVETNPTTGEESVNWEPYLAVS